MLGYRPPTDGQVGPWANPDTHLYLSNTFYRPITSTSKQATNLYHLDQEIRLRFWTNRHLTGFDVLLAPLERLPNSVGIRQSNIIKLNDLQWMIKQIYWYKIGIDKTRKLPCRSGFNARAWVQCSSALASLFKFDSRVGRASNHHGLHCLIMSTMSKLRNDGRLRRKTNSKS